MKLALILTGLLLMIGVAKADAVTTGAELVTWCSKADTAEYGLCIGYVLGAVESAETTMRALNVCIFKVPEGTTNNQLISTVMWYLHVRPNERSDSAANYVQLSMNEAYPCPK